MHSLLEQYLEEVAKHLQPMPPGRRASELREMRTHLKNAVADGLQRGCSEEDAAHETLQQFGMSQDVGHEVLTAWRREARLSKRSFWGAAACTLSLLLFIRYSAN